MAENHNGGLAASSWSESNTKGKKKEVNTEGEQSSPSKSGLAASKYAKRDNSPGAKKIRGLHKKIREIESLETRLAGGEKLQHTQMAKIATKLSVQTELNSRKAEGRQTNVKTEGKTSISSNGGPAASNSENLEKSPGARKRRSLKKKIHEVEASKRRLAGGEKLDDQQMEKFTTKSSVQSELTSWKKSGKETNIKTEGGKSASTTSAAISKTAELPAKMASTSGGGRAGKRGRKKNKSKGEKTEDEVSPTPSCITLPDLTLPNPTSPYYNGRESR